MNCSEFVSRFTDYVDGTALAGDVQAMEEHLGGCESCRRYKTVVEHGAQLLRSLPAPELREDFEPRLQHRLYHVLEERSIPETVTSRAPALTVFGIAVLLTAVAWSPLLRGSAPVVELEPIIVDRAPSTLRVRPVSTERRPLELRAEPELAGGLWDDTRLYEYTPLSRRYEDDLRTRQVGLAPDG
ncbi:MAG TPA: zf-HC2 domain-containing protein [Longimicrobiales bacterium]|nr:zf-HC2 domain-containing protein [Longimicrobiales bacterium]